MEARQPTSARSSEVRLGRPPKLDEAGVATRERLLRAAAASCAEQGFEGVTVVDIAQRAAVSAPAIYNHFGGKVELLVEAGRLALGRLSESAQDRADAVGVARGFLAPGFAESRRLLTELHLAAQRHREVAQLLASWHDEQAELWRDRVGGFDPDVAVKAFFALLLGLCQIDALSSMAGSGEALSEGVEQIVRTCFQGREQDGN